MRLNVPLGHQPSAPRPSFPNKKAEKAFREKMSRNEMTRIYGCLDQYFGGLDGNRDQVLDEVIHARKSFTQLSGRYVDKPTSQSNARVPFLLSPFPIWGSYRAHGEQVFTGRQTVDLLCDFGSGYFKALSSHLLPH